MDEPSDDIVVTGELRGAVKTDIKPEVQLDPADIRAYGASNVSELITALQAQLGSGSGRGDEQPVILISGRRSNMSEVRNLPTEAIERIDILPEEVALQYGYGATQKVINFVLRRRFQALTTVLQGGAPTAGGNAYSHGEVNVLKLNREGFVTVNVKYDANSSILESERGVTRAGSSLFDTRGNITGFGGAEIDPVLSAAAGMPVTVAGVPAGAADGAQPLSAYLAGASHPNVTDLTPYRTLTSPKKDLDIDGVYKRALSPTVQATATIGLEATQTESLLGLPSGTLRLPAGNPFSPFSQDVQLLRYYDNLNPLSRHSGTQTLNGGVNITGDTSPWVKSWRWSFNANYQQTGSDSTTVSGVDVSQIQARLDAGDPTVNPFGPFPYSLAGVRPDDWTETNQGLGNVEFLTNGALFKVPAGDVNTSIRVTGQTLDYSNKSFRVGPLNQRVLTEGKVSRDTGSVRGNISIPITSRRRAVLDAIGDLSINGNVQIEQVSDFGQLTTTGYGLNWTPIPQIQAIVSVIDDSNAPTAQQLGDPLVSTPNVRIYDFTRGESVDITQISGGNPSLGADSRHVFRLGLNIRPLDKTNLTLVANYTNTNWRNQIRNFPGATAEIEAAFPDRFVRDPSGRLVSVDFRPVAYDRTERSQLRWGFNLFLPIPSPAVKRLQERRAAFMKAREESRRTGQPMPPEMTAMLDQFRRLGQQSSLFGGNNNLRGQGQRQGQNQGQGQDQNRQQGDGRPQGDGQPRAGGPGGGRGFGGGGRGGFGGGGNRIILSAYHTWVFKDESLIRPGIPVIDRLDNTGSDATPQHRVDVTAGIKRDSLLFQLNGNWQSGTETTVGMVGSTSHLTFGSVAKVNLLAEFNPGIDALLKHPWLRGSRIQLNVDNLFDARQRVTDQNGVTPAAYMPNLIDPVGRVIRLTFRKQLF